MNKQLLAITVVFYVMSVILLRALGFSIVSSAVWSFLVAPLMWLFSAAENLDPWLSSENDEEFDEYQKNIEARSMLAGVIFFGMPILSIVIYYVYKNA